MRPWLPLIALALSTPLAAYAQDDDDPFGGEDEPKTDAPKRLDEDDEIDIDDDEGDIDAIEGDDGDDVDLLGEDDDEPAPEGSDTAAVYRAFQAEVAGLAPDEEHGEWQGYLEQYPDSNFAAAIEKRLEELEQKMYASRIRRGGDAPADADLREIKFSQGLQIESINPRDRIQAGFEWGLPNYINLFADYEHQLMRQLSIHGGLRHRYTGWRIETGARYALVKSTRTQTLVTLIGDVHFNTLPAYPVFRPMVGAGKKFGDVLDAQLQIGTELDTRNAAGVRIVGGANVTYRASENVAMFLETQVYMQSLASDTGATSYRFNTANFGLKFFPVPQGMKPGQMEMNLGASVPYSNQYWGYHYGSIMGQMNYYL